MESKILVRLATMASRQKPKWVGRFLATTSLSSIFILTTACVPKDVAIPTSLSLSSSSPAYAGFTGASTAQTVSSTKVKLTWSPSSDPNVVAYNVYDSTFRFSPKLIKTVTAPASEVTLTDLAPATYYQFRVHAANASNVEDSNTVDVPAIPYGGVLTAQPQTSTSAIIPFNDGSNADQINVYCQTTSTSPFVLMAGISNVTETQTTLTGLTAGTQYTCRVAVQINGFVDNNTVTTTFVPIGVATQLVFSTQPGNAAAGVNLATQPTVTIEDANGNVVTAGPDSNAIISLDTSAASPTAAGLSTATAVAGVATFSGINYQLAGAKILTATKPSSITQPHGSGIITADSSSFTISAGPVSSTKSSIAISPAVPPNNALVANGNNSYTVTITLEDQYGNPVVGTKPTFASSISGDSLSQPVQASDANGVATGSIASTIADTAAPYRLLNIATPSGLTSDTVAAPFVPGSPTKLAFSLQPVNSPAGLLGLSAVNVAIEDAQGNIVNTGTGSTASVTLTIASNVNGATLSGTVTQTAVNGIATFNDLGIDKTQVGYRLLASSGSYTPAYSNSFNVTAGTPHKIIISGPTNVISGTCSTAFTVQLQDQGSNPANAIQSTPVALSGLGSAQLFTSSACGGTALTSTLTFTAGTNTKTVYLKDEKAEALIWNAADTSGVLLPASNPITISTDKITLLAQAAPPAAAGTPLTVVAGHCSTALVITPEGDNGNAGPTFTADQIAVSGILGSSGNLYADPLCQTQLNASAVTLPVSSGTNYTTSIYFMDNKAEALSLSVLDLFGVMTTTSGLQAVTVLASNIGLTGPSSVVSGLCSTAFTVSLQDALGNLVPAPSNTMLSLNGLSGSANGQFYISSNCSGTASNSTVNIPQGSSSMQIYFKDSSAETLHISLSDPTLQMATSPVVTIGISPSALTVTNASATSSATSVCAGPFLINTVDGGGNNTSAITPITVGLTGAGTGGFFFYDSACSTPVTTFTFAQGVGVKHFYYLGQYPNATLTFTASDTANVLSSGSLAWSVTAAKGWIGTSGSMTDVNDNLVGFLKGKVPVSARVDGPSSVYRLHFDSTKQYLYVVDSQSQRILKYDYLNTKYLGWIGDFNGIAGIGIVGSNIATPSTAQCVATAWGAQTPGWCVGGLSTGNGNNALGSMNAPDTVADDGTYIYVTMRNGFTINRYNATTGAFAGWVGRVWATPTAAGPGGPASCTTAAVGSITPGWCIGGQNDSWCQGTNYCSSGPITTNPVTPGIPYFPTAVVASGGALYVATQGAIFKYNTSDGSFAGWIGYVSTTPTGGYTGCTTTGSNVITPGWCTGGKFEAVNPKTFGTGGGINTSANGLYVYGNTLYVVNADNSGTVNTYNVTTGTYLGPMPNLNYGWSGSTSQIAFDGTDFYFADWTRMIQVDTTGVVQGWVGKVNNNNSMSGSNGACATLVPNADTPGWCLGGSAKHGISETSFNQMTAVEYDGNGYLVTGEGGTFPAIKKWSSSTGVYQGTLAFSGTSPTQWSNDATSFAQNYGFDDASMMDPVGMYNDGTNLYLTEWGSARIKKIALATGTVLGWVGGITSSPTGGASGCVGVNAFSGSPGWCLGSLFNPNYLWNYMIDYRQDGIMQRPVGITGDGTYLYTVDESAHRIQKWNQSTGAYVGWIGAINVSPTGPAASSCVGAAVSTFTPGWCTGGFSQSGTGDGMMTSPTGIVYVSGNLYVIDGGNQRVSSYNATTGAFNGWIGRVSTNPTSGCTFAANGSGYSVSTSGWCKGGTAAASAVGDKGGGFDFLGSSTGFEGITTDNTYLYIPNTMNARIDKIKLDGTFQGATYSNYGNYSSTWTTNTATLASWGSSNCQRPQGIVTASGSTYMYGTGYNGCYGNAPVAWKMVLSTGTMVGYQGAIAPSAAAPTGGDTGCAGATQVTPGWCQGGALEGVGYRLGQFSDRGSVTMDNSFVYVSDQSNQRVTRLPK